MTLNLLTPIKSSLNTEHLKATLETLKRKVDSGEVNGIHEVSAEAMNAFKNFFMSIGEPNTKYSPLEKGIPPSSVQYNRTMEEIQSDIEASYREVRNLENAQVSSFNFSKTAFGELKARLSEATSKVVDLNLLNNLLEQDILVGGDDFLSTEFIDSDFPLQNTEADILINSGIVVLKRTGTNNVATPDTKVKVIPLQPAGVVTTPTYDNENRFYEGDYFDYAARARPEGDQWHLETLVDENIAGGRTGDTSIQVRKKTSIDELHRALDRITAAPDPSSFVIIDLGASEEEKESVRKKMLDEDPTSWWESEYVITTSAPLLDKDEILSENGNGLNNTQVNLDPNLLRQRALNNDIEDLIVEITLDFPEEQNINFITLNPFNFGETAWIDVLSIEIASGDENFRPIRGFNQGLFDNTITDEANEFLNEQRESETLAPSRFSYKGQGVWSFPSQTAKIIKFRIRQRVPIPNPYHKMHVLMTRTIRKSRVSQSGGGMM